MRFAQPSEINANYKIVTPMFLEGANRKVDDQQFRTASFKGALRFWWRALRWPEIVKTQVHTDQALKVLHQEEADLFGIASDAKNSHQSAVRIVSTLKNSRKISPSTGDKLDKHAYLLGLGLYANNSNGPRKQSGVQRDYLEGGELNVSLQLKPTVTTAQRSSLKAALIALGVFGGLGSRARKGFGSLAIQSLQDSFGEQQNFTSFEDIQNFVNSIEFIGTNAPLSAFSNNTFIAKIDRNDKDPLSTLMHVGTELQGYRDGTVNRKREDNFRNDRVIALDAAQGKTITILPGRAAFGLPHNYQWTKPSVLKLDITPKQSDRNRRASPLFIHIHQFPNSKTIAVLTLLAADFLPTNSEIQLKSSRGHLQNLPHISMDYTPIHNFLERKTLNAEVIRRGK